MSFALPYQPSLASATNTRVETAARHNQQCRVSTDDMTMFVSNDPMELQRNKYRYCVHKDELVMGVGRPWAPDLHVKRSVSKGAYPPVISNLGDLDKDQTGVKMIRYMNHMAMSVRDRKDIIDWFRNRGFAATPGFFQSAEDTHKFLQMMFDFHSYGVANTLGWAHPNNGDTMTSVMIGGLRTVLNGDFEVFAGDLIQFYWAFEKDDFEADGRRKSRPALLSNIDPSTGATQAALPHQAQTDARKAFQDRQYSPQVGKNTTPGVVDGTRHGAKLVARVKPYVMDEDHPRIYDWTRVIGVAISSARPFDMVDIKIQKQSM